MWNKILIAVVFVATLSSCKVKKSLPKIDNVDVVKTNNANFAINNLSFQTFSGRAKTKVEFGTEKQDVTLHIRMNKDKAIWISVVATMFSYEVARVLITPDSIKIMNKYQSEYTVKPFNYIEQFVGKGVAFSTLQDLLLANVSPVLLKTENMTVASAVDETQLVGVKDNLSFQYSLNKENRPKVFRLSLLGSNQQLEAYYGSFNNATGYLFPQNQQIKINGSPFKITAILDYNKLEFNQVVEMPFSVPEKYKIIN